MLVYCYKDSDTAGDEMKAHLQRHGAQAQMVTHPQQVEKGEDARLFAYMPIGQETEYVRDFIQTVTTVQKIACIPSNKAAQWCGRRVDQYVLFGQWMPTAWLCRTESEVRACVNHLPYPIRSVANSGDARKLNNPTEAFVEATEALSGGGIALSNGNRQEKYVLWQVLLEKPSPAWRVIMFARKYAIAVMLGGDQIYPMDVISEQIEELLEYVWAFMTDHAINFGAVTVWPGLDPVRGVRGPWVDEFHTNWPPKWFMSGGMIFETTDEGAGWKSTGIPAVRWYDVVAKAIVEGEFDG